MSKHTPGPWLFQDGLLTVYSNAEGVTNAVAKPCHAGDSRGSSVEYPSEATANARLIAEAGTVATETGLTPRQLAEQRAELLEACKLIDAQLPSDTLKANPAIQAIRAAIAKAEGN